MKNDGLNGLLGKQLVGVAGFEPATPTSRKYSSLANRLILSEKSTTHTGRKRTTFTWCSPAQVHANLRTLRRSLLWSPRP